MQYLTARAVLKIRQERPYEFDNERGIWLYRQVDDEEEIGNILTNAGRVAIHTYVYGTAAQRVTAGLTSGLNYIGLSNNGTSPAAGDTSLAAELTTDGLQRVLGTVTLPTGSGTVTTIANTFTYTGATQQVQKTALFDASSGGNMAHEILFTPRTLTTGDTLQLTFSITLGA